jgi:hypothetical protein
MKLFSSVLFGFPGRVLSVVWEQVMELLDRLKEEPVQVEMELGWLVAAAEQAGVKVEVEKEVLREL